MNILVTLLLLGLDRILKIIFINSAVINSDRVGAGVLSGFVIIPGLVLLKYIYRIPSKFLWLSFIISGGVSNLIDLILYKGVIDYIHLFGYYLNFSDVLITIGIGLLLIELIKWKR